MSAALLLAVLQVATPCRDYQGVEGPTGELARLRDKGIGILVFATDPTLPASNTRRATITLYAAPSIQSRVVGRFSFASADLSWSYQLETPEPGVCSNALEYGYEEDGLPIDSMRADNWVRVIYGIGSDQRPRLAWVQAAPVRTQIIAWPQHLEMQSLFFLDEEKGVVFYTAANGALARFEFSRDPETGRPSYYLEPLQVRGPWMQVRVVTPSDMCGDRSAARDTTFWIRYLDERRRPLVWYYTRGC